MVPQLLQREQLHLNYSMSTAAAAAAETSEISKRNVSEAGRDYAAHVSSYGANRIVELFKKAVRALAAVGSTRVTVRNKTHHTSARSATNDSLDDEAADRCHRSAKGQIRLSSNLYPVNHVLTFLNIRQTEECKSSYLQRYSYYCRGAIAPPLKGGNCTLCPCIPNNLSKLLKSILNNYDKGNDGSDGDQRQHVITVIMGSI